MEKTKLETIKGKKLFGEIFTTGKKYGTELINGIYIKNENNLNSFKFGVAVSKKISKKAVLRNRYKRLLRESVRQFYNEFPDKLGIIKYIVIIWKIPVTTPYEFSFKEIRKNVFKVLRNIEGRI